jgi:primosomal replication protein N
MSHTKPGDGATFQRPCLSLWPVVCHTPVNRLDPSGYFMYHLQKILQSTQEEHLWSSRSWFRASSFIKLNENQLDAPLF